MDKNNVIKDNHKIQIRFMFDNFEDYANNSNISKDHPAYKQLKLAFEMSRFPMPEECADQIDNLTDEK